MFITDIHYLATDSEVTRVSLKMDAGTGLVEETKTFSTPEYAKRYINYMKVQYFTIRFGRWLAHLRILHHVSSASYYKSPGRDQAFIRLTDLEIYCTQHPPIEKVSSRILKIQEYFLTVLPATSNPSFKESYKNSEGFIAFAKQHAPKEPVPATT